MLLRIVRMGRTQWAEPDNRVPHILRNPNPYTIYTKVGSSYCTSTFKSREDDNDTIATRKTTQQINVQHEGDQVVDCVRIVQVVLVVVVQAMVCLRSFWCPWWRSLRRIWSYRSSDGFAAVQVIVYIDNPWYVSGVRLITVEDTDCGELKNCDGYGEVRMKWFNGANIWKQFEIAYRGTHALIGKP
ncbi:hypothetical protein Tco_0829513 [Tanacetum coccineum]